MIFKLNKYIKRCRARIKAALDPSRRCENKGTRILMYHSVGGRPEDHRLAIRVPAENFERQLEEIAALGYKTFTISELVQGALEESPDKGIAITFDDGYKDNASTAAVKLKTMGFKATFFVTTSYIDRIVEKRWADGAIREFMTWEDVVGLSGMGFEIGSHMVHHVDLTSLSDSQLRSEFEDSRDIISRHIGRPVTVFSYPRGKVDGRVIETARKCGYTAGCSSFFGWNTPSTNPYLLKRTEIDGYDIINNLTLKLYGYHD